MIMMIDEYVSQFNDEELWQMIDDYESWKKHGTETTDNSLLRNKSRDFCDQLSLAARYHTDFMAKIAMEIYRHFAMKYKAIVSDT